MVLLARRITQQLVDIRYATFARVYTLGDYMSIRESSLYQHLHDSAGTMLRQGSGHTSRTFTDAAACLDQISAVPSMPEVQ